jgi:hypothetical protein
MTPQNMRLARGAQLLKQFGFARQSSLQQHLSAQR